jgi:hypothetical protein
MCNYDDRYWLFGTRCRGSGAITNVVLAEKAVDGGGRLSNHPVGCGTLSVAISRRTGTAPRTKTRTTSKIPANQRYPKLLPFWDAEANGEMADFMGGSKDIIRFKCPDKPCHRFLSTFNRLSRRPAPSKKSNCCPVGAGSQVCLRDACNSLWTLRPDFRQYWDPANDFGMERVMPFSNIVVKWLCAVCRHHWEQLLSDSSRRISLRCPRCLSVAEKYPELLAEWDYEENGAPTDFSYGSKSKVSWICLKGCGHRWIATIDSRTLGGDNGCPISCNHLLCPNDTCNSLASKASEALLLEWDSEKNPPALTVLAGSHKKFWWKCSAAGHEWEAVFSSRTGSTASGCPGCRRLRSE